MQFCCHSSRRTVRKNILQQRMFTTRPATFAHLHVAVTTFMLVRTSIPSTPTSSSSNPVLSTLKQARTLKQALSRMNSQAHTLKQDLARARTGTVNNILLRMMNILVFYNVPYFYCMHVHCMHVRCKYYVLQMLCATAYISIMTPVI